MARPPDRAASPGYPGTRIFNTSVSSPSLTRIRGLPGGTSGSATWTYLKWACVFPFDHFAGQI
eukprot:2565513-Rhodomonas_salina.1